jgi:hypothetical protein
MNSKGSIANLKFGLLYTFRFLITTQTQAYNSYLKNEIPNIKQVANNINVIVIDVYAPLVNHREYFPDGVNPDSNG